MSEYKASCYALQRAVRAAKLRYRERIESHFQLNDSRCMWQGLRTIFLRPAVAISLTLVSLGGLKKGTPNLLPGLPTVLEKTEKLGGYTRTGIQRGIAQWLRTGGCCGNILPI